MTPDWILENVPLAPLTTLGIGGPARYLASAKTEAQVRDALGFASARSLPVFILGGGSNVLVSDSGFPGMVLRVSIPGIHPGRRSDSGTVRAGAGESWDRFVSWAVERDWAGAECLSGIPGTVGGTPVQNVGAYGQEVSEIIASVRTLARESGEIVEMSNEECSFGYRSSVFNTSAMDRFIVLSVRFSFRVAGAARIHYPDLQQYFSVRTEAPTLADVRDAVRRIRAAKAMLLIDGDPDCRSAGSFFKNPVVEAGDLPGIEESARRHGALKTGAQMPEFALPGGRVKIPAAWLIEGAGFPKGTARGRVGLSAKHTLALVNRGDASAREVLDFMREIQDRVEAVYGVRLMPEPVFVGFNFQ